MAAGKKKVPATKGKSPKATETAIAVRGHGALAQANLLVGIGASAGGLEALFEFFDHLGSDSGCTFFIAQHQSESTDQELLANLIRKHTSHEVLLGQDGMPISRGVVYVAPPGNGMALYDQRLQIMDSAFEGKMTIDLLLRSLALEAEDLAVAVILSGSNTDGTLGARSIRERNGLIIVQDPKSTEYSIMPQSVINEQLADLVLKPSDMPAHLAGFASKMGAQHAKSKIVEEQIPQSWRDKLLLTLKNHVGHDFALYKDNTINRRIRRRMDFHQLDEIKDYVMFLRNDKDESKALFRDFLIGVTNFFRDPEVFEALGEALKGNLRGGKGDSFRCWVPGCATGEEAYSLAILIKELFDQADIPLSVDIYATDINPEAIDSARRGRFHRNIEADISEERLKRFFVDQKDKYQARREIREMLVFAEQNIIQDPPFSNIDLVVCRNLLMYMKPEAQKRILSHFRYALKPKGLLLLGTSESVSALPEPFDEVNKKHRIFRIKKGNAKVRARGDLDLSLPEASLGRVAELPGTRYVPPGGLNMKEAARQFLLAECVPPSVLVNRKGDILYFHGRTGKYLEPSEGIPSVNVLEMAREGLSFHLSTALTTAAAKNEEQVRRGIVFRTNGQETWVNVRIKPTSLKDANKSCFMITFHEVDPKMVCLEPRDDKELSAAAVQRIRELEEELRQNREDMQAMIEEYEAANEELKSSNEELQSTNEELKSTNEELETAKEEMQSINEEQVTLNSELQGKNEQLQHVSDDMKNLLASTQVATLFLDDDLLVRRFTPQMSKIMSLRETDVGRPVGEIAMRINFPEFEKDVHRVLEDLNTLTREVRANDSWFLLRIMPYRTVDNVIDGAVATFTDITPLKRTEQEYRKARELAESTFNTIMEPLLVLDSGMRVISANRSFCREFKTTERESAGKLLYDLNNGAWNLPSFRELLEEILPEKTTIEGFEMKHDFPGVGKKRMRLNARALMGDDAEHGLILLAFDRMEPLDE